MRTHRSVQFRVGLLVSATAIVFVGLLTFLIGSAFDDVSARYLIRFEENVKGMVVGSKVNFQGVPIGAVSDINFRGGTTEVEIDVDPRKAEIQTVTRARLDRLLVTGQVTIELEGYERGAARLPADSFIEPKDDPLHQLRSTLPEIATRVETSLVHVDRLLASLDHLFRAENVQRIDAILASAERVSGALPEQIDAVVADTRRALAACEATAIGGSELLGGEPLQAALCAARDAALQIDAASERYAALAHDAGRWLRGIESPLVSALLAARESLREVQGFAQKVRRAPSSLVFGQAETEIRIPGARPAPDGGAR